MSHLDQIEKIEQVAFAVVVQALKDYMAQAAEIFENEVDLPQDIAEDVTREAIDTMGVSAIREQRLYGKVDYKKAIYVFLPNPSPVALMVDAKAEREDERTATIQMSQTSMRVRMTRANKEFDELGHLEETITRDQREFHVTTVVVKYAYEENNGRHKLKKVICACIPNGKLQSRYNPDAKDTIWLAGRDAPTRGEDFRVRLHFKSLKDKAPWRVCEMDAINQ